MEIANIGVSLAFLAGLASFFSPCVFAVVPAYIGYLGGRSVASARGGQVNHWTTFSHGLAFVLGFSLVFVALGVASSALGGLLYDSKIWLARIGGVVVIIFGLHMTGLLRIPFLEYDLRPHSTPDRKRGYLASFLMGIFFSAGWAPCVGPILGAILTLSFSGGSVLQGVILLSAYSAGLAIPFLIASIEIVGSVKSMISHTMEAAGVTTTASGLQYKVIKPGTGRTPTANDTVTVHYRGTLVDGTEFDSSYKRGQPAAFPVGGVIAGWTEALQLMKEGAQYQLVIPPALAYGDRGPLAGQVLIFDVELLSATAEGQAK